MQVLFKRIPGGRGLSHRQRALQVTRYMSNDQNNKCILLKGFNFRGCSPDDPEAMARELADIATIHDRENRFFCLAHYALSLQMEPGDEKPSPELLVRAARHAMTEMGATPGTPYIIAVHDDKNHPHAHILISRVDRDEWRIVDDRSGLDGEFLGGWKNHTQFTAASVAQAFGWDVPPGSRYIPYGKTQRITLIDPETGLLMEWERPIPMRTRGRRSILEPPGAAVLEEQRTGLVSRERRIQEKARGIDLSTVADFPDLHARLASVGLMAEKVERKDKRKGGFKIGSGLVFTDGIRRVKGSHIGSSWSLPALEKALGSYAPPTQADIERARAVQEPPRLTPASLAELKKSGIGRTQIKAVSILPASLVKDIKSKRSHHTALGLLATRFGAVEAVKMLLQQYPRLQEEIRREEKRREIMFKRSIERSRKKFWKEARDARYKHYADHAMAHNERAVADTSADIHGGSRGRV